MCHIYRRTIDAKTGEYRRGEYVGYVDTSHHVLDGTTGPRYNLDGTPMSCSPDPPTVQRKPRLRLPLVADLQEFRAWRRYQKAYSAAQTYDLFDLETP